MSSKITTQGFNQVGSLSKTSSLTVSAWLELVDHQDFLELACRLESWSQVLGLREGIRLKLLVEANHVQLVATKIDPHKSIKAKHSKSARLRRRIIYLRRQQRDHNGCADVVHNGFRVGSSSWSQYATRDSNPKSPSGQTHPRETSR